MPPYKRFHDLLLKLGVRAYPDALFRKAESEKVLYLTFDDGPTPEVTSFVLETLQQFGAKACFFLIGRNAIKNPEIVNRITALGHSIGAHSMDHENGWKTNENDYLISVRESASLLKTSLFRPPYGRLKRGVYRQLKEIGINTVFWDVLSYDFDTRLSAEDCINLTEKEVSPGSIVVFHDSRKAFPRLEKALPTLIQRWKEQGYSFRAL